MDSNLSVQRHSARGKARELFDSSALNLFLQLTLIGALAFLSFGIWSWDLGLYLEDWDTFYRFYFDGVGEVIRSMATDRIFSGLPHAAVFSLFGFNPAGWVLSLVLLHVGSALLLWAGIRRLWPNHALRAVLIAALFVVYPSVLRFGTGIFLLGSMALFLTLLSIYLSIPRTVTQGSRWLLLACSILCQALSFGISEIGIGMEGLRLIAFWQASGTRVGKDAPQRMRWVAIRYLPHLLVVIGFVIFRLFIFPSLDLGPGGSSRYGQNRPLASPGPEMLLNAASAYTIVLLRTWRLALERLLADRTAGGAWLALPVAAAAAGLVLLAGTRVMSIGSVRRQAKGRNTDSRRGSPEWLMLISGGLALLGLAMFVFIIAGARIAATGATALRSYTLTIGAAVAWIGLLGWLASRLSSRSESLLIFGVAVLVAIATGSNYVITTEWVQDWRLQQDMWQQLTWRAPQLADDTTLIISSLDPTVAAIGRPTTLDDLSKAARLVYNRSQFLLALEVRELPADFLLPPNWESKRFRDWILNRDRILVAEYGDGCLRVFDRQFSVPETNDYQMAVLASLSNVEVIVDSPPVEPSPVRTLVIGGAAINQWCYHYQRAGWFVQRGQWDEVVGLLDSAQQAGLEPQNPVEWLPFIEALDHLGAYDRADGLIVRAATGTDLARRAVQALLEDLSADMEQANNRAGVQAINQQLALIQSSASQGGR